jgi:signal transduction histidine kinase
MELDIALIASLQRLHEKLSTKTKTIILVLGLFVLLSFVFVYLRYLDTRNFTEEAQAFYVERIQSVYTETFKRTEDFYRNRGFANLNSFGITEALIAKDAKSLLELSEFRWNVLKSENPYLTSMSFYGNNGERLAFLGRQTPKNFDNWSTQHGFWLEDELYFRVIIPWRSSGFLIFEIDPRYFLSEISQLIGIEGMIVHDKTSITLEKSQIKSLFEASLNKRENIQNIFTKNGALYTTHRISQSDVTGDKNFEVLFFQDITPSKKRLNDAIFESVIIVMILGVVAFVALHVGFEVLIRRIEELNTTLERRVADEIQKRMANEIVAKEKEQMLIHQSKLASMGEMIGNIAHQWRQPLTQLGTILIAIELLFERGKLSTSQLRQKTSQAEDLIAFMSNTIDDFRNFFASNKQRAIFSVADSVRSAVSLMDSALKNNNITCKVTCKDNLYADGYGNEVAQVLLNLIANAKDVLLERNIQNPYIQIHADQRDNQVEITILDNGKGVSIEPIEKIFEPYVSTKHASSGTGIGLYMSKIIIEKHSFGTLHVKNTKEGALFSILLPTP